MKIFKDLLILNNLRGWAKEDPECWWPTMIWIQFEIYNLNLFKICIDFQDMTFELFLFGFGITIWPFDEKIILFYKDEVDKRNKRIQIVISCAIYWHFFQIYNDEPERFLEILGFRI